MPAHVETTLTPYFDLLCGCMISAVAQAGLALPTPEGMPVEAVTPDVCLSMVAAVPAELGSGDIRAAREAVQSTATGLQVCVQLHHCPGNACL